MFRLNEKSEKLLTEFNSGLICDAVLFIGAGVSHSRPTNLPSWNEVVDQLLIEAKTLFSNKEKEIYTVEQMLKIDGSINTFLTSIEKIREILGPNIFHRNIQKLLSSDGKTYPPILHDIVMCDFKGIITTNLDTLIEDAYADALYKGNIKGKLDIILPGEHNAAAQLISKNNWLWKIHGTLNNPDSWMLSLTDYYREIYNQYYMDTLINIFQNTRIVFIGYSAEDVDLLFMLEKLHKKFGPKSKGHILLTRDAKNFNLAKLAEYSIDVIEYGGDENHQNLCEIIKTFKKKTLTLVR